MWAPAAAAGDASTNGRRTTPSAQNATPASSGSSSSSAGVWGFDASPFDAPTTTTATTANQTIASTSASTSHGGIGPGTGFLHSHVSKSRMLWNRTAPEEEEREEEALPSYLTYLQPAFRSSSVSSLSEGRISIASSASAAAAATSLTWGDETLVASSLSATSSHFVPSTNAFGALSPAAGAFSAPSPHHHHHAASSSSVAYGTTNLTGVETKTKELAFALQEFVRQQIEQQPQRQNGHGNTTGPCNCEPLKLRVSDLEHKLLTLQQQISGLISTNGTTPPRGTGNSPPPGINAPPPSTMQHPPLPPIPPPNHGNHVSGGTSGFGGAPPTPPLLDAAAGGITDRVSTLEGRQSAFQSQLAQISKVLGVPIGKHGKNSQIKNLVQTLREEIDTKLTTATKDMETKCIATTTEALGELVSIAVDERLQDTTSKHTAPAQLPYDAVFGALAEEHEASLAKLSGYFEDRLSQEGKQRVELESRIQSRFGEHEEWLQQLEGEFGSWHDRSSSVASQLRLLQNKMHEMDTKWAAEQLKWSKLAADIQLGAVGQTAIAASNAVTTTTTTTTSVETLTRSVHQLQAQYKQFHSDYKTETSELRENLLLMDTWVKTSRHETRDLGKSVKGMKQLVEKLVRDTGSAEELLQQYVSTITHQVASVTRQYVSVRIRDNNRLIDATLRARVPAYVANESESFMLVRPEKKAANDGDSHSSAGAGIVLKDDDDEGIQKLLQQHVEKIAVVSAGTSSESSGASSPSKNGEK